MAVLQLWDLCDPFVRSIHFRCSFKAFLKGILEVMALRGARETVFAGSGAGQPS